MTAHALGLMPPSAVEVSARKKRVLLVDASSASRDLRAETMRKLGMDVDCAADIGEARSWWRADLYNLVLMNTECESGRRDRFCEEVRGATPPQQLAFLVGKPAYLADSPNADGGAAIEMVEGPVLRDEASAAPSADVAGDLPQRWGILEASRQISAVRSLAVARSRAVRDRPAPPRDLESRSPRRSAAWSQLLPELQKEEMQ